MKMFVSDKDGKVNFVDENNVFLGYEISTSCCENPGFFITSTPQAEVPDPLPKDPQELTEYRFDTHYFCKVSGGIFHDGGMVIFKAVSIVDDKPIYIHLFNIQNGYYSHGFQFSENGKDIQQDSI